jgi:hypothetical protein
LPEPEGLCHDLHHAGRWQDLGTREYHGLAGGLRRNSGRDQTSDEIVDVHRLMLVAAAAYHRKHSAIDHLEKLEQPAVAGAIGFRDANDRARQLFPERAHNPLGLELRL